MKNIKNLSLRSFITVTVSLIVTLILLCSFSFYYIRTDRILTTSYENSITSQFSQVNQKIRDQIDSIDSIIPLYVSNASISRILENTSPESMSSERKIAIEKQMTDVYYSTPLSAKNFTNGIYILNGQEEVFRISTSASPARIPSGSYEILRNMDKKEHRLVCRILPSDEDNIYFVRNLFDSNMGRYNGTFIIALDLEKWLAYCVSGLDPSWFICLYDSDMNISSNPEMTEQCRALQDTFQEKPASPSAFQELTLCSEEYFTAVQDIDKIHLTAAVIAPKRILFQDLNSTLKTYLLLLVCTVLIALLTAVIISRAVTRPIDNMVSHINQISNGEPARLPPMRMYREFQIWADAFNQMLKQLDIYYNDNFQKQLLLKSSEIRALQSQMNPHFLFNVLNTVAWKAQMSDNEEIYQMIISLGEFLKINTLSREKDYVRLAQEIEYVKFYVYLQQMRFED
jgi:sensor histidine kinase YesM